MDIQAWTTAGTQVLFHPPTLFKFCEVQRIYNPESISLWISCSNLGCGVLLSSAVSQVTPMCNAVVDWDKKCHSNTRIIIRVYFEVERYAGTVERKYEFNHFLTVWWEQLTQIWPKDSKIFVDTTAKYVV